MPLIGLNVRAPLLLGQIDNWRRLGERFSGENLEWRVEDSLGLAALALALVGGFWLLSRLGSWQQAATDEPPRRLFAELARAHRLGFLQRRYCREVARQHGLAEPAELFVRADLREALQARDAALATRLFGQSESPAS